MDEQLTFEFEPRPTIKGFPELCWTGKRSYRSTQYYPAQFRLFYENIMDMALYETGITAEFGDTFLMLSTCAYHEEDGRLVVLAKRSD